MEPTRITIGGPTRAATGVYVRNEREASVVVVNADAAAPLKVSPLAFVSRTMLKFDRTHANQIVIESEGLTRTLTKRGMVWRMTAPVDATLDINVVNDVLADLAALDARTIVGMKDQLAAYGLDHPAVRCTVRVRPPAPAVPPPSTQPASTQPVEDAAEEPPPAVTHTVVATRHEGKAYLYVEGGATIAEIDDKILRDLSVEPHRRKVTVLDTSRVTAVELTRPDRTMLFEKRGNDWLLDGEPGFKGDATKLRTMYDAVRDLSTERYVAYDATDLSGYGLDVGAIRVTVRLEDGSETRLIISDAGPPDDENKRRYAVVEGTGKVFLIAPDDVAKFDKQIQDFRSGT